MLAAVPAASKGTLTDKDARWLVRGVQAGYASPVSDGERIYVLDNGGVLFAFDVKTGKQLWHQTLGTIAKASPVLADGKLYIGTENTGDAGGKFYIIRPHADRAEILDQDWLGTPQKSELIIASPIVARGRIYVTSMDALYAIGPKRRPHERLPDGRQQRPARRRAASAARTRGDAAGDANRADHQARRVNRADRARPFDANGNAVANPGAATWTLEDLKGTVADGKFTPDAAAGAQAGTVKATVGIDQRCGSHPGDSRPAVDLRLRGAGETPPAHWINATGKFAVRDGRRQQGAGEARGEPVRFRQAHASVLRADRTSATTRSRRTSARWRSRRQMGDVGIVAQRYEMVLFGNHQRLELQPWQPEVAADDEGGLHVETGHLVRDEARSADARRRHRCGPEARCGRKVKPEPAAWTIERIDPIGSLKGSPGIYADAMNSAPSGGSEMYYDNIKVYRNKK